MQRRDDDIGLHLCANALDVFPEEADGIDAADHEGSLAGLECEAAGVKLVMDRGGSAVVAEAGEVDGGMFFEVRRDGAFGGAGEERGVGGDAEYDDGDGEDMRVSSPR